MREFVTDERIAEMAYGAHASVRFVALGDFFGVRMFVSPPEVADAIDHELDMELLPHVRIVVADVSAALGQLEAILGLAPRRDVDRTVWRGPGVVVTSARAGQHLDGYRLEVALLEPATTIAFSGVSPPGEVVVGGRHPKAGAIAAWMRALVSPQRR